MGYLLEIKEEANREVVEAFVYYENKREGLGEEFLDDLDSYFSRITANPEHFPSRRKPYREAVIKRFPFIIIYEILENRIVVYSVFNTWQDPDKKKS
ncbi:type II toxin-antitoxin system RelE/ParE family toxin [Robertkochia sediminum]|uniref:type II toxin-antitoxin system RelE/ParE family toxin n=1 Tax=Robertkochia sediminum TaxID=2785326 RepID=UPI001933E588|nr:type II toxin-antitoxin system RelE/ParE family toxin [Robertkochia sediminum]MBL7473727.1 type II toxin-antitoxin system RelE/ParE family toxin [Robertkochia sediminum]